ncbi:MAG: hypothetical protein ACRDSH_10750, partial [Pseudonocardiaceae bacterium]
MEVLMSTRQQGEEPEQRGGLGGRVRRFIDSELGIALDKDDRGEEERHAERRHKNPERDVDRFEEPVTPRGDTPGHADHPLATPSAEPRDETPVRETTIRETPVHGSREAPIRETRRSDTRVAEPAAEQPRGRTRDEAAIDASAERVGLLNNPADLRDRWQRVQGTLVDNPQRAVEEASALVEQTLREIHANVTRHPADDPTSTEDLRVSFQRYREFFDRLLSA